MSRFALCPHCGFFTRQLLDDAQRMWVCQIDLKHVMLPALKHRWT